MDWIASALRNENPLASFGVFQISMTGHRETWTSDRGFVLGTMGVAVGLGSIWRFSHGERRRR